MDLKYCKDGMRKNRVQGPQTDSEVKCYERRENPPRPWVSHRTGCYRGWSPVSLCELLI